MRGSVDVHFCQYSFLQLKSYICCKFLFLLVSGTCLILSHILGRARHLLQPHLLCTSATHDEMMVNSLLMSYLHCKYLLSYVRQVTILGFLRPLDQPKCQQFQCDTMAC
ncbi:hypothetical protein KP509_06G034600 [Ceratopteris richardii]|uniref:Uncharacterized protein n=1 Tax=Ceratopteris richardii TaxID=49495 RepID=A0A8T2UEW9_CERRI|nr:hypothetical protein KP509_06G034600 [Ceratopteris richardii]